MVGTKAVRSALYAKLNVASVTQQLANGSASLHHAVAPPTGAYPLVIFNKQAGTTVKRFGGQAFKDHIWLVKAVDNNTTSSKAEDIDAAVNAVLDFQQLTISGGSNMFLARESDVDYLETDGDQQFRHHGALYRLVVQD